MNNFAVSSNVTKQYRWWSNDSLIQRFKVWDIAKDIVTVHVPPSMRCNNDTIGEFLHKYAMDKQ